MTNGFENIAMESRKAELAPWVLIAGGFRFCGGMDKANAALAAYLLERKTPLHLVTHQVDPEFSEHPGMRVHLVPRDRKSTRLNSSHGSISYAVFCLKKKKHYRIVS